MPEPLLHPQSFEALRQLILVHGADVIMRAIRQIQAQQVSGTADAFAEARRVEKLRRVNSTPE